MAAEEGDALTFIFTGVEGEVIPRNATRFIAHESVKIIPPRLFQWHPNIVELICHAGVIKIERKAFYRCPRLRRVIIPGVKGIEGYAFYNCEAVTYVECDQLERIGDYAFTDCKSLSNIDLPSAKVLEEMAFAGCEVLIDVKFGKSLESIRRWAFFHCHSLKGITFPLKNGIPDDGVFQWCGRLESVDLVDGTELREIIAALLLEEWRNDMNVDIDSIHQILPNTPAGDYFNPGGKTRAIREWITSVLRKVIHYKAQHRRLLTEASTSLMHALPNDIVMNDVLPFLELPLHTFEGEDHEDEGGDNGSNISDDTDESYDTSDGRGDDVDGDDDDSNNNDDSHNASLGRGHHEEEEGEEVQRKRRKTTNDDE